MINEEMSGKVCVVTGANSGMGKIIATELANKSATLIIVCRIKDKPQEALNQIISKTKNPNIELMITDLSSQKQVRELAKKIKEKYNKIDVLINNAGCMSYGYVETPEGIETTLATNHLAPFLLTNLLLNNLKESKEARIINVASEASKSGKINFENINLKNEYSSFKAYAQSKLANILFTYELARRLKNHKNISVNCVHPGIVPNTKLGQGSKLFAKYISTIPKSLILTPEEGARTTVWLACSKDMQNITGKYFYQNNPIESSPVSYDLEVAQKLWDLSAKLTGL
ncbi:MAG: SDR family oxidoreductase [Candidatus Nanoarchaeia archaeon]|nr:SDR family oxidoreductase [Candidatus Nanoarchaeia archaeon]